MKNSAFFKFSLPLLFAIGVTFCFAQEGDAGKSVAEASTAKFKVRVFYLNNYSIGSMLKDTISSVSSPDFSVVYQGVPDIDWYDTGRLGSMLVSTQQSDPADGFFLACKANGLHEVGEAFRAHYPKVPFVDSFSPSLLAANVISYRYAIFAGSIEDADVARSYVGKLGITSHVRRGAGSSLVDSSLLVGFRNFDLTTEKGHVIPQIVAFGEELTGSDHTASQVINIEAIALVGCHGFLDLGVASEAESKLLGEKIPLQVINPVKASIGLLYSLVRNRVWISS